VGLENDTWSGDVIVPPQLMLAVVHNGGFVACGYAPEDPKPAGFVFGFLGIHDHHFGHHSHMLAVLDPYRGRGLTHQLHEAQRDRGEDHPAPLEDEDRDGVAYLLRADGARPGRLAETKSASHLLLEIPRAFQDLKARDPKLALEWRLAGRAAFERALGEGYAA